MKRIISISLCVAMLLSMIAMTVSAYGSYTDQVTTENVMKITTDKDSYKPGDTIVISASMESIWGDPDLVDNIEGLDYELPGAYGMNIIQATVIFDRSVFSAKAYTNLFADTRNGIYSTILNSDALGVTVTGNNFLDANSLGTQNVTVTSAIHNLEDAEMIEPKYCFFNGSGDLWKWNLTIKEDAAPGTYYLPVGPYRYTAPDYTGYQPDIAFLDDGVNDRVFGYNGNVDSLLTDDHKVRYDTGYDGPSRVDADHPELRQVFDPYDIEGSYIEIVIEADITEEDISAAAQVDALIDEIGTVYNVDGKVYKIDSINYDALYTHVAPVPATEQLSISFKMMPIASENGFGFLGGVTAWDTGKHHIFYDVASDKFVIGKIDSVVNASECTEVLAESAVMNLPDNKWTDVEFIYNGSTLSVKCNGAEVVKAENAQVGYSFYIFYPSQFQAYVQDMKATWNGGSCAFDDTFDATNANAYSVVDIDSGAAITAASDAYEALSTAAKTLVTKKAVLDAAIAEYAAITAYDDQKAANTAITLIDAIGTVNYPVSDQGPAIAAAEAYCATLTETQLGLVHNYETLVAARTEYDRRVGLYNQAKADEVIAAIDAIGTVSFESRAAIEAAEAAYDLLNDDQKALVSNYQTLLDARAAYELYGPIMNAESLISALGTKVYQGTVTRLPYPDNFDKGYHNFPDADGDNCTWGATFTFDFMYTAANASNEKGSNIAIIRDDRSFAGYDFKTKSFAIGEGGGFYNGSNGLVNPVATKEYDLVPGKWYTMTIDYTAAGVATVSLDGEVMVSATTPSTNYSFFMFYPQQVDLYIGDNTVVFDETYPSKYTTYFDGKNTGDMGTYAPTKIDVVAPVNYGEKIAAAEAAVEALSEEQLALLADSYKDALVAFKAQYEPLYAEVVAAAAAVDETIANMDSASESSVAAAKAAYDNLSMGAKTLVTGYAAVESARATFVVNMIAALGEITPASESAIAAAEAAYRALSATEMALVDNYQTLTDARTEITALNKAVKAAEDAIAVLQAGGSAIRNNPSDANVNAYSQFNNAAGNNPENGYTYGFDVYVESANATAEESYMAGFTGNNVGMGYDFKSNQFKIVASNPWGNFNADQAYATLDFDLAFNTWYNIEYVVNADSVKIIVDGVDILSATVNCNGYMIYYPSNCSVIYDNVKFTNAGALESIQGNFSVIGNTTKNWIALAGDTFTIINDAPIGAIKKDADLVAAARAAYEAVPAKAQYAVANYDILVEAEKPAEHVHNIVTVAEVPADCLNDGLTAYEYCTECDYATVGTVIPATGHTIVTVAEVPADCLNDGLTAYEYCSECDYATEGTVIPATGHTIVTVAEVPADCLNDGLTAYEYCSKCDYATEGTVIPATGHTIITVDAKAPTATEPGWDAYEYCSECDYTTFAGEIPALGATAAVQALIDALNIPEFSVENIAAIIDCEDAIAEAQAAYEALTEAQKAEINDEALVAALAAYNKALVFDNALNGSASEIVVEAVGGVEKIDISWNAVDNAVKYWIYVGDYIAAVVNDGSQTSITLDVEAGSYDVKVVVAVTANAELGDAAVYVSGTSDVVTAEVTAAAPVAGPVVETSATENSITATWTAVDGAQAYYVYITIGNNVFTLKATDDTTITLANYVTADSDYSVVVKAVIADGANYEFIASEPVTGKTDAVSFVITGTDGTITWGAADGAEAYWVKINNDTYKVTGTATEFAVPAYGAGEYSVVVMAYVGGMIITTAPATLTIA